MNDTKKIDAPQSFLKVGPKRIVDMTMDFFRLEAAGGILLVLAAVLAMLVANSSLYPFYDHILNGIDFHVGFSDGENGNFQINKSLLLWINDGLMAIFFLLVGLEIKREVLVGELSGFSKALLPILAAIGGMMVPAAIYYGLNAEHADNLRGWAIPCATDIAFALGVLSLLGSRVPVSLKILLTAVAIIDDLGAILIIALFYTADLHTNLLYMAIVPVLALFAMNRANLTSRAPYILAGVVLWILVLKSGVHATMAGVITALFIPLSVPDPEERRSPAQRLEHDLHPWVVYLILPVFAFANAGVPLSGLGVEAVFQPVTLGIMLGLFVGKQLGVFASLYLAIKSGLCQKPDGASWSQLYGVSILCGIGFTMSLFIGGLAFSGIAMQAEVRIGVIAGSILSAVAAYMLLRMSPKKG